MRRLPRADAPSTPPPSLVDRIAQRRPRRGAPVEKPAGAGLTLRGAAIVALLLPAGPLVGWAAAELRADAIVRATEAERRTLSPRIAERRGRIADAEALATSGPGIPATANALARTLPDDARLVRLGRGAGGKLAVEVATTDPDALRSALRGDPLTRGLRDLGQQRGDAAILVRLGERRWGSIGAAPSSERVWPPLWRWACRSPMRSDG